MTAVYIILGIAAFFVLAALVPINVRIVSGGEKKIYLKILFLKFLLAPKKEKPPKLSAYKIGKFRKNRLKEEKKLLNDEKKKKRKELEKKKYYEEYEKPALTDNIEYFTDILKYAVITATEKFGRHLKIKVKKLYITVAGGEPDKVALKYGYVCQAVSYILEIIDQNLNMKCKTGCVAVDVDFIGEKPRFDVDISFGLRLWQIISTALTGLIGYLTDVEKPKPQKKSEENKKAKDITKTDKQPKK